MSAPAPRALDDATLVALSDLNHLEANRELARRAGGVTLDGRSRSAAPSLPVLANAVVRGRASRPPTSSARPALFAAHRRGFARCSLRRR
jgi:hypothetical protein